MIWEVIESIIQNMDNSLEVVAVSSVTNGEQTITFSSLKWMKLKLKLNGKLIKSYNGNSVTLKGVTAPYTLQSVFTLDLPLFLSGTLSNTKHEWDKFERDEKNKLPFIWLTSPTTDNENEQQINTAECNLWFVHWSDWKKLNKDRQTDTLKPLNALLSEFMRVIQEKRVTCILGYSNKSVKDFPKFGNMETIGVKDLEFNSTLSALEMNISLEYLSKCCNFG